METPNEWIELKAEEYAWKLYPVTGHCRPTEEHYSQATRDFLDLLHSQGKLQMPDNPTTL